MADFIQNNKDNSNSQSISETDSEINDNDNNNSPKKTSPFENKYIQMIDDYFEISSRNSTFMIEILAGIAMFFVTIELIGTTPKVLAQAKMDTHTAFVATCFTMGLATISSGFLIGIPLIITVDSLQAAFLVNPLQDYYEFDWKSSLSLFFLQSLFALVISIGISFFPIIKAFPSSFRIGISYGLGLYIGKFGLFDILALTPRFTFEPNYNALIGILTLIFLVYGITRDFSWIFINSVLISAIAFLISTASTENLQVNDWFSPSLTKTAFKMSFSYPASKPFLYVFSNIASSIIAILCVTLTAIQFTFLEEIKYDTEAFSNLVANPKKNSIRRILILVAAWSLVGAVFGTVPLTVAVESCVGAAIGAKTGFPSVVAGLLYFLSILIFPLFNLIPAGATGSILIFTTAKLLRMFEYTEFQNIVETTPIIISTILIPVFIDVARGFAFGYVVLILVWVIGTEKKWKKINLYMIILGIICGCLVFVRTQWNS
ncbi:xanthine/uracil permease [Anaeramoeba ignava]|uniref:Xanthine/uracil permease n=1 Tax=Anaeramoeba ignava TaxID=1746090 RepID=A0A9Q0LII5_ANAIG|nr:xanthine/uracil permease [Anaeramoeba ignava]